MMGLRLIAGIDMAEYNQRFDCDMTELYRPALEKNIQLNRLVIDTGHLRTTAKGMMVLNDILVDFMN